MALLNRRQLLLGGGAVGLSGLLRRIPFARAEGSDPHFLICIQLMGGVDPSYVVDGRAAKLTERGLRQNYLLINEGDGTATQPNELTDEKVRARTVVCERTGSTAIRSPLFDEVWNAHKDRLSIINGVHMLSANDGHDGNSHYLWNNDASSDRPVFPPKVGAAIGATPLESVIFGVISGTNLASTYNVTPYGGGLGGALASGPRIDETTALGAHLLARADANAHGDGVVSRGSAQLANGLRNARRTTDALGGLSYTENGEATVKASVKAALQAFTSGLTRVAAITSQAPVDLHDAGDSQSDLVPSYRQIARDLRAALDLLTTTTYEGVPFIERTTFLITSEFGRTNKSFTDSPVGATGSDHNVHGNSVLIGGKGITPGLVVGETDLRDCDDAGSYLDVSPAHRQLDPQLLRMFGKPFDFQLQRVRTDLPQSFREEDHIMFSSVTNTILDAFAVPASDQLKVGARVAPPLSVLRRGT